MNKYLVFYDGYDNAEISIYDAKNEKEAIFKMYKNIDEYTFLLDDRDEDLSLAINFKKWLDLESSSLTVVKIDESTQGILKTISCGSGIKEGFFEGE